VASRWSHQWQTTGSMNVAKAPFKWSIQGVKRQVVMM